MRSGSLLKKEVLVWTSNPQAVIRFFFSFALAAISIVWAMYYRREKPPERAILGVILSTTTLIIGSLIYRFRIQRVMVPKTAPMKYFKKLSRGLFQVDGHTEYNEQFKIVETKEDIIVATELNVSGFKKSVWKDSFDRKFFRNNMHVKKNKYSMILINKANTEKPIGFSHVLPVNERVWNLYLNGKFTDKRFSSQHILSEDCLSFDDTYGLISFTIWLEKDELEASQGNENLNHEKAVLMEACTAYHYSLFLKEMCPNIKRLKVLFTNWNDQFYRPFQREAINGKHWSGDFTPIYVFEITNKRSDIYKRL